MLKNDHYNPMLDYDDEDEEGFDPVAALTQEDEEDLLSIPTTSELKNDSLGNLVRLDDVLPDVDVQFSDSKESYLSEGYDDSWMQESTVDIGSDGYSTNDDATFTSISPDEEDSEGDDGWDDGDDISSILNVRKEEEVSTVDDHEDNHESDRVISGGLPDELQSIINRHANPSKDDFGDEWDDDEDDEDDDTLAGFDIDAVLGRAIEMGASDVHINADDFVTFSVNGDIVRIMEFGVVVPKIADRLAKSIISHRSYSKLIDDFELDAAYTLKTGPYAGRRTRISVGFSFGNSFVVFRVISDVIPTPNQLGVDPRVQRWTDLPNGMVLICGPTGSGKSTTFASMIRRIQMERAQKIITIESPIEYIYGNDGKALVVQREVGPDAHAFSSALTSAMRQSPDIIMVGEVRNRIEVDELLRASETGHLSMSTMHTNSPPATISRIMSLYEGDEQRRILTTLKTSVRGIANQVLMKDITGKKRFSVQSVLEVNDEVSDLIGNGDADGLTKYMRSQGTTMEHELVKAYRQGRCTLDEAKRNSPFPYYFDQVLNE